LISCFLQQIKKVNLTIGHDPFGELPDKTENCGPSVNHRPGMLLQEGFADFIARYSPGVKIDLFS
jgi:hypothetical protein